MLIRVRFDDKISTVDYDPSLGFDVLVAQLVSINNNDENMVLVDFGGHIINSHDDIEDIKVIEISDANSNGNTNSYNRLYSTSYDETSNISNISIPNHTNRSNATITNNNENDDWAQHLDLTNNNTSNAILDSAFHSTNQNSPISSVNVNTSINTNNNMNFGSSTDNSSITNAVATDDSNESNGISNLYNHNTHIDAVKDVSYGQSLVRLVAIADVWIVPNNNDNCTTIINSSKCSSSDDHDVDFNEKIPEEDEVIQPCYIIADTNINICARCISFFDPSLVTTETNKLRAFSCNSKKALKLGLGLFPNAFEILKRERASTRYDLVPNNIYLRRKLLNQAISLLPDEVLNILAPSSDRKKFMNQLRKGSELIYRYEDAALQKLARSVIDYDLVNHYAQEFLEKDNDLQSTKNEEDVALLAGLLRWFKTDFFKWCNKPECTNSECLSCGSQNEMESLRTEEPNAQEVLVGQAGRTEVYRCKSCGQIERFPRFTDPGHLLVTKRGRCGEWASAFCLICRSLNLDARWVLDFTDHVWVEVWLPSLRRFVHADPCENKFDTPLLYESGWNKNLEYILSFSRYGVVDSTPRYSRKLNKVISKRSSSLSERFVQDSIKNVDNELEMKFSASRRNSAVSNSSLINLQTLIAGEKGFESLANNDISIMTMKRRKRLLSKELVRLTLLGKPGSKEEEFEGRISGSKEWKESRGEDGGGKVSISPVDNNTLIFPTIAFPISMESASAPVVASAAAEVNAFGLGLGSALDDDALIKCKQFGTSLLRCGWFCIASTFILDPITGVITTTTTNTTKNISTPFYASANEKQKLIFKIFESNMTVEGFEKLKFLLKKEKVIVFHCSAYDNNTFDQDVIGYLLACRYLSRSKFVVNATGTDNDDSIVMKYVSIGGQTHPDTRSFDTTSFLSELIDALISNNICDDNSNSNLLLAWKHLHLNQISILSSPSLTNGLQVQYNLPFCFSSSSTTLDTLSPLFAAYSDNPTLKTLNLYNTGMGQVRKIDIRCGALIDKIEINVDGEDSVFSCGGSGGESKSFEIPLGWELLGFFGGTGGHLHNVGVVIRQSLTSTKSTIISSKITSLNGSICTSAILEMLTKHDLYGHQLFNTGILLKIINTIFNNNENAVRRRTISACAIYAANITNNSKNFRTVNKDNKFFQRNVVNTVGGLDLFLFGPVGFSKSHSHYTNTIANDMIWLQNYSNFLYELSLI